MAFRAGAFQTARRFANSASGTVAGRLTSRTWKFAVPGSEATLKQPNLAGRYPVPGPSIAAGTPIQAGRSFMPPSSCDTIAAICGCWIAGDGV